MKARIHRELCVGVKNCVAMAPGYFEIEEDGRARVIKANMVGQGESCRLRADRS